MFFQQIDKNLMTDKNLTIDQLDFSNLSPLKNESKYFPKDLMNYISNAAEETDVDALKHILKTVQHKGLGNISSDRVIDQIYFTAITHDFSPDTMEKLFHAIPIHINRPIKHVYAGMCEPPKLLTDSLLNIAVAFHKADIVDFLLAKGADLNHISHDNETPEQELERILKEDLMSSEPYNLEIKKRMLESIKNAKEEVSFQRVSFQC